MQLSNNRPCLAGITLLIALSVVVDALRSRAACSQPDEPPRTTNEHEADDLYRQARRIESADPTDSGLNAPVEQYRRAYGLGHSKARIALSRCYLEGRGVAKDHDTAIDLVRSGAADGDAEAGAFLGWCYEYGLLDANDVLADGRRGQVLASWLAILMREDDQRKRFMLEADWGMKAPSRRLPTHAIAWYRFASAKGDVGANFKLAVYYIEFANATPSILTQHLDRVYVLGDAPMILLLETYYSHLAWRFEDADERIACCRILAQARAVKAAEIRDPASVVWAFYMTVSTEVRTSIKIRQGIGFIANSRAVFN